MSKFKKLYEEIMGESINDKNLFKAVFLAGGAGVGKSFINDLVFKGITNASVINSDELFELGSMYNHLYGDPKLRGEVKKILSLKKDIKDKKVKIDQDSYFTPVMQTFRNAVVKPLTTKRALHWINGMLPIIIDGTGKDVNKIKKQKEVLEWLGYDTAIILVDTDLETAQQRNLTRPRTLERDKVEDMWNKTQANKKEYKKLFGKYYFEIDNSKQLDLNSKEFKDFASKLAKLGMKLINSPLKNEMGKDVIKKLKDIGGKYYSDLGSVFGDRSSNLKF